MPYTDVGKNDDGEEEMNNEGEEESGYEGEEEMGSDMEEEEKQEEDGAGEEEMNMDEGEGEEEMGEDREYKGVWKKASQPLLSEDVILQDTKIKTYNCINFKKPRSLNVVATAKKHSLIIEGSCAEPKLNHLPFKLSSASATAIHRNRLFLFDCEQV